MQRRPFCAFGACVTTLLLFGISNPLAAAPRRSVADRTFDDAVHARIETALDDLEKTGDFKKAETALAGLFDQVIAWCPADGGEGLPESAAALRLVRQLSQADKNTQIELLEYLRARSELASTLAFLVQEPPEKPAEVYDLLNRLRAVRGDKLGDYPSLTAALCVVHDTDEALKARAAADQAKKPSNASPTPPPADALQLFDYFAGNEKRMLFVPRAIPAELLVYMVDAQASLPELQWALQNYAGNADVGTRFHEVTYDYSHLNAGTPKAVEVVGRTLPVIKQFGGVCAEQAHFAATVGKAIGVPAVYTRAASGEVSHAWVGYLQTAGKVARWNFEAGRYDEYKGLRGQVFDPQLRRAVADGEVSLLAALLFTSPEDRRAAAAFTDAVRRLIDIEKSKASFDPPALVEPAAGARTPQPRKPTTAAQLALVESALNRCAGYAPAWLVVRDLAADGKLNGALKTKWIRLLDRFCGRNCPDFSWVMLKAMIETETDVNRQNGLWNTSFASFQGRDDLAAEVRMAQAKMWEDHNQPAKAIGCYEDVIGRYANSGPFVITALTRMEKLLLDQKRPRDVLRLYEAAWAQMVRPRETAFQYWRQSNWFRVGSLYAERLDAAGMAPQANAIRATIGAPPPTPAGRK